MRHVTGIKGPCRRLGLEPRTVRARVDFVPRSAEVYLIIRALGSNPSRGSDFPRDSTMGSSLWSMVVVCGVVLFELN